MTLKLKLLKDSIYNRDHGTFTRLLKQFSGDELNLNEKDDVGTPLHIACMVNNPEALSQLLSISNINVNIQLDRLGFTPFMVATYNYHIQCVELMAENENVDIFEWHLRFGDLETIQKRTDEEKQHVVKYIRKKREERIQTGTVPFSNQLMEYIDIKDHFNFNRVLKNMDSEEINKSYQFGMTPLHLAILTNNHRALEKLMKVPNIDLEVRNSGGCTPYVYAFIHSRTECLELLLQDLRVDIFPQRYPPMLFGPIAKGSEIEKRNIVKSTEEEKSRRIKLGKVSLRQQLTDSIIFFDSLQTSKVLAQMTSDQVNEADPFFKNTPLHLACAINNSKAVAQLLKFNNIALNAKNKEDNEPFMIAVGCCSNESIEILMGDSRIEINFLDVVNIGNIHNRDGTPCNEYEREKTRELIKNLDDKREKLKKMRGRRNQNKKSREQEITTSLESAATLLGGGNLEEVLEFIEGPNKSTNKNKKKEKKKKLKTPKNDNRSSLLMKQAEEKGNLVDKEIEAIHLTYDDTISQNSAEDICERNNNDNKSMIEEFKHTGELHTNSYSSQNSVEDICERNNNLLKCLYFTAGRVNRMV